MIQLGLILALVTSLLGAGTWFIHSQREIGRNECIASHAEAARMAELRSRERSGKASADFDKRRGIATAREKEAVSNLERIATSDSCLSDRVLESLNDHLREARGSGEPSPAVPGSTGHPGQK